MHGLMVSLVDLIGTESILEELPMNKPLFKTFCLAFLSVRCLSLCRGDGGTSLANMSAVNSVSELRTYVAMENYADVMVRGYYEPGDGGTGQFFWDSTATENDDGGVTIVPNSNPRMGRWKRSFHGQVNVKWFGAVGDGNVMDSAAIQAALDFVDGKGGGNVFIPRGTYRLEPSVGGALKLGDNTMLEGEGPATILISKGPQGIRNKKWDGFNQDGSPLTDYGNSNLVVQNLTVDCGGEGAMGVILGSVTEGTIHNVRIKDPSHYAVWLLRLGDTSLAEGKPTKRVTVSNCHVSGVVDTGIECSGAVGCTIVGNTVTGTGGLGGFIAWNGATDCVFSGNIAEGEGATNSFVGYEVQASAVYSGPGPNQTQTQRITFVGNIARNVRMGAMVAGSALNKPSDVLIQGNSFYGLGKNDRGIEIEQAVRVNIQNNLLDGFEEGMIMNDVRLGLPYNGATYISIENNTIKGGGRSLLYGNVGGSLRGNKYYGQRYHAVSLFSWKNCAITDNVFVNLGTGQDTVGIVVLCCGPVPSTGNLFTGNRCMDDRDVKWTTGAIKFSPEPHDRNIVTGNGALGAKAGARAFWNFSTGTNNIVANNIDG